MWKVQKMFRIGPFLISVIFLWLQKKLVGVCRFLFLFLKFLEEILKFSIQCSLKKFRLQEEL